MTKSKPSRGRETAGLGAAPASGSGVRQSISRQPVVLAVEASVALVDVVRCAISAVDHTIRLAGCGAESLESAVRGSRPFLIIIDAGLDAQTAARALALAEEVCALLYRVTDADDVAGLERELISQVTAGFARHRYRAQ